MCTNIETWNEGDSETTGDGEDELDPEQMWGGTVFTASS